MRRLQFRSRFALLAGALVFAVACDDSNSSTSPQVTSAATSADRAFIDGMVPHHGMAVLSADMAIARAVHPELKAFAQKMKDDQQKEIDLLKSWKVAWFGTDSVPSPMMPADIPAGPNFDLQWMKSMMTHHQGAIDMSTLTIDAPSRAESDSLSRHIIDEQRSEQQEMQAWAKQWYGATMSVSPRG
jgi:uncharacterized protein (DUF305 family)